MATASIKQQPKTTPWGVSECAEHIRDGIILHRTATHGGYELSAAVIAAMPLEITCIRPWAGGGWYEEDCDWALICLTFPEMFSAKACAAAINTVRWCYLAKKLDLNGYCVNVPAGIECARKAEEAQS